MYVSLLIPLGLKHHLTDFLQVAYQPLETPLMRRMRPEACNGWVTVDGLAVLVGQGIAQYELFTKRPAPIHVMRHAIHQKCIYI